ncbi:NUDIX hydrolase [Levilactobacillus enshiensis]|uniref:NUDIX hydrolase n=1 Tax=Levilactobacillus enshiensis TaxID=2590213 RepID=UPI0011799CBB|nr:NUDIX hydrolase [Levilactobacillus enshiensis]
MTTLIAHALIATPAGYLLLQRTPVERGQSNIYPLFWDIPGGRTQPHETARQAAKRECLEETGLHIQPTTIIGITTTYDQNQEQRFTRLIFTAHLLTPLTDLKLNTAEHGRYATCTSLATWPADQQLVPYLRNLLTTAN